MATEACRGGQVEVDSKKVKAARNVHIGETISAQVGDIRRKVKVLGLIERRVGAQLAKDFMEDLTPSSEYEKKRDYDFTTPSLGNSKQAAIWLRQKRRIAQES